MGKVDMLLVTGTSLSITGVKRIIKEMSRSLRSRPGVKGRIKAGKTGVEIVYVNDEASKVPGEWEGVFDIWIQGDIQRFVVDYLDNPGYNTVDIPTPETPKKSKVRSSKKEREGVPPTPESMNIKGKKRVMEDSSDFITPPKRMRVEENWLLTPRETPPSPSRVDIKDARERLPSPIPLSFAMERPEGFEGSLTPLLGDKEAVGSDEVENPFADLGRGIAR